MRNAALHIREGRVAARVGKRLLPAYGVFDERRYFLPGRGPSRPLTLAGLEAGVLICEDFWDEDYPRHPAREALDRGADALLALSASPFRLGVYEERLRRARRHGAPFLFVNALGAEDELVFDGGSFALDAGGSLLAALPRFEEALEVIDLSSASPANHLSNSSPRSSASSAAHFSSASSEAPLSPEDPDTLLRALVQGLRGFAARTGVARAVLGLSGGIDSALTAVIAAEALGPASVTGIAIPSRWSDPRSLDDARALARTLGIGFETLPLEPLHAAAAASLAPLLEGAPPRARASADENAQARLRMLILMGALNARGGMLLSTSNKSELCLGYGTLYGDLAGAIAPLGDLWKSEVLALARRLEVRRPGLFPPYTLARPPSAELAPGQVDPFDYARLDPLLEALLEGRPPASLLALARALGLPEGEAERAERLLRAAEWKRRQGPVILKVHETSFGSGRVLPLADGRPLALGLGGAVESTPCPREGSSTSRCSARGRPGRSTAPATRRAARSR
jgi:NAD+ synthase (glutamine-hydrolysing)